LLLKGLHLIKSWRYQAVMSISQMRFVYYFSQSSTAIVISGDKRKDHHAWPGAWPEARGNHL